MQKKVKWINGAKFLAIMAVVVNHTFNYLYTNSDVGAASHFSVSLFILISGILSYKSNERHELTWYQTFLRSSKSIIIAYLIASAVHVVLLYQYFDFQVYIQLVIGFPGSKYYVLLYIEMMLVSRLLFNNVKRVVKFSLVKDIIIGLLVLVISFVTTEYTNVFNIYGGGENTWRYISFFVLSGYAYF